MGGGGGGGSGDASVSYRRSEVERSRALASPPPPNSAAPSPVGYGVGPSAPRGEVKGKSSAPVNAPMPAAKPGSPSGALRGSNGIGDGPTAAPALAPVSANEATPSKERVPGSLETHAATTAPSVLSVDAPKDNQRVAVQLTRADLDLLARRLGKELALVAVAAEVDPTTFAAILKGLGITLDADGRMQVVVLIDDASKGAIKRLSDTGAIVVTVERKLVILHLTPAQLAKVARVEGVRKVDFLPKALK